MKTHDELSKMTVKQLKDYAKQIGCCLGYDGSRKDTTISCIDSVDRVARDRYRSKALKAVCDLLHPICQKSCASYEVGDDEWCVGVLTEVDGE